MSAPAPARPTSTARAPRVGVVLLHHRTGLGIAETLESVERQSWSPERLLLVDNASRDGSLERIRERWPALEIVERERNAGYAAGMNAGIARLGDVEAVLLLTQDCVLAPEVLELLCARLAAAPEVGMLGPLLALRSRPGRVFSAGGRLRGRRCITFHQDVPSRVADWEGRGAVEAAWLDGACLLVRRATLDAVGPLDEGYFLYLEETELALRARRAGWRVECVPGAHAWQEPGPRPHALWTRNRVRFLWRNAPRETAFLEAAVALRQAARRWRREDPHDREVAREKLRGLWAVLRRADPSRLYRLGGDAGK